MGIIAGYETAEESFGPLSPANDYIPNAKFIRKADNLYVGNDAWYWPFVGKLSFFAYAPYISDSYLQFSPEYVSGFPVMVYAPTAEVSIQPDFCIARPLLDRSVSTGYDTLKFQHTLSQVLFSANYTGNIPATTSNLYVKVDSIRICNVIGRKTVEMSDDLICFKWRPDSSCSVSDRTSYFMNRFPDGQITDIALPKATEPATDNYLDLSTKTQLGRMYLLPQSMQYGDCCLEVSYGYYENVGGKETLRSSITTTCNLPQITWEPSQIYRYKFTINLAASSLSTPAVSVEGWGDINNTESNPHRIE